MWKLHQLLLLTSPGFGQTPSAGAPGKKNPKHSSGCGRWVSSWEYGFLLRTFGICLYRYIYICIMSICICVYIYIYAHICIYVYIYAYMYIYICISKSTAMRWFPMKSTIFKFRNGNKGWICVIWKSVQASWDDQPTTGPKTGPPHSAHRGMYRRKWKPLVAWLVSPTVEHEGSRCLGSW